METSNDPAVILGVLSAMLTPAVLISACASLAISTSNRLARAMDRTRKLGDVFRELVQTRTEAGEHDEAILLTFAQLDRSAARTRLLHRALSGVYFALAVFVTSSVTIGLVYVSGERFTWLPTLLGAIGIFVLFFASTLLIKETRIAREAIESEMDFLVRLGQKSLPPDLMRGPGVRGGKQGWTGQR